MRPRLTRQEIADRRHAASMKQIEAIERTAQAMIRVYETAERADERGEPHSEALCKEAEAVAAMARTLRAP